MTDFYTIIRTLLGSLNYYNPIIAFGFSFLAYIVLFGIPFLVVGAIFKFIFKR